ncbi:MAG: hypothetical protein CBC24_02520 [Candidatus Pelagibacter sp. TMED64]|nr:hypothetical protein [Candidatus Pelagibacter sp.]OUU66838.1 MAG: hypothetical protein CBC24_02520 [Candidatus Pelagibacter sp. TMED64]
MKYNKIILIIFLSIIISSCSSITVIKDDAILNKETYSSTGFALIYKKELLKEKILNKKLNINDNFVLHKTLKPKTILKLINPDNLLSVNVIVQKQATFPHIYNIVIPQKIFNKLKLDPNNPFIELIEIKKNKTFIAKKQKIFDEEKQIAQNAPVKMIIVDNLSEESENKSLNKKNFKYNVLVSDFYFLKNAILLKNKLSENINMNFLNITKINNKNFRLWVGPFDSFVKLESTYNKLHSLGFENLDIF